MLIYRESKYCISLFPSNFETDNCIIQTFPPESKCKLRQSILTIPNIPILKFSQVFTSFISLKVYQDSFHFRDLKRVSLKGKCREHKQGTHFHTDRSHSCEIQGELAEARGEYGMVCTYLHGHALLRDCSDLPSRLPKGTLESYT